MSNDTHARPEVCGAIPPDVRGPVPCHLAPGHEGKHYSTSGCAGSEIRWGSSGPDPRDVEALTDLLDLMSFFPSNEQRARYLLSCNWMRERGAAVAAQSAADLAALRDRATVRMPPEAVECCASGRCEVCSPGYVW